MPAVLIDTNVLVYAHDRAEPEKQRRAIMVLDHLNVLGSGCVSAQVLAEFFRAVTRGTAPMLKMAEAARQVDLLARGWPAVDVTPMIVLEAVRGVRDHRLAYWDAQVWATARLNQIPTVLSENFGGRTVLQGVRFANPFAGGFDIAAWA
jgi:predicted nucleic acid-binding protein